MGKLTKAHFIEFGVWLTILCVFYAYSFEFDQEIEIYKFGASAWPRAILLMLFVVMIGNLFYQKTHGSAAQQGRVGVTDDELDSADKNLKSVINVAAILLAPLVYAWSLKPIGFYSATPLFIATVIVLLGERRIKQVLTTTAIVYGILIGLFVMILNAPLPQGTVSPFYDFSALMLRLSNQLQHLF